LALLAALAGCQTMSSSTSSMRLRPQQNLYIVFFTPGMIQLTPEAQDILRDAASAAMSRRVARIEVAVPPDVPGGRQLREGRFTAIQNLLSASGVRPGLYARAELSTDAVALPGAADRAEIRLLP
jgi:hypothetical protein